MSVRKQPNGKWYYTLDMKAKDIKRKVLKLNVKPEAESIAKTK